MVGKPFTETPPFCVKIMAYYGWEPDPYWTANLIPRSVVFLSTYKASRSAVGFLGRFRTKVERNAWVNANSGRIAVKRGDVPLEDLGAGSLGLLVRVDPTQ